jgi:hypothetical protein
VKENDYANGFDVETRRKDAINGDTFVSERIAGEDVNRKQGASVMSMNHRPPHGEYNT